MHLPEFFDAAPRITVRDPLARFLGATEEGVIEYSYADEAAQFQALWQDRVRTLLVECADDPEVIVVQH